MNPLVSNYPYILLLAVYSLACAFSVYNVGHVWYWTHRAKERNLFLWSVLLPLLRISALVTGFLFLILSFVVILAVEGGLSSAASGGSVALVGMRIGLLYGIGITFWVIPFTMYLLAMTLVTSGVRFGDPEDAEAPEPQAIADAVADPEEEPQIPGIERWKEVKPWDK